MPNTLPARLFLASLLVLALAAPAAAEDDPLGEGGGESAGGAGVVAVGHGRSIGVGVERTLGGIAAATFVYDAGKFHIDGLLGFLSVDRDPADDLSVIALAGRFFWVVHRGQAADFSLGGGLGIVRLDDEDANDTETNLHVEAAAKIRAFLVPNVCISGSLGIVLIQADNFLIGETPSPVDGEGVISLGGQVGAAFGMTYFF